MGSGTRRGTVAVGIACLLGMASTAAAATGPTTETVVVGGPVVNAKVHTDGTLTVGGQETLTVKRIPTSPKRRLAAYVSPLLDENSDCFRFKVGFCEPEPLFRVPGTPRLRASHKGRGRLTFVMPPAVEFENFVDPLQDHPVPFTSGERIAVEVEGTFKPKPNYSVTGPIGATIATVEVPPPS